MTIIKYDQVEMSNVIMDGANNVSKAITVGTREGWDGHVMRLFRIGPGGYTPKHAHDWEHVVYVATGNGKVSIGGDTHELERGDYVFVPPNAEHQFRNSADGDFEFICIVPDRGEY